MPTTQLLRFVIELIIDLQQPRHLGDARLDLLFHHAVQAQREPQVLKHRHVRVQGVILKHERDVALLRRQQSTRVVSISTVPPEGGFQTRTIRNSVVFRNLKDLAGQKLAIGDGK